jgi:hypothetical protein
MRRKFRTNHPLWIFATGCVFGALGFVDPTGGLAKGKYSFWDYIQDLVTGTYAAGSDHLFIKVMFYGLFLIGLAALVGWLLQALLVVMWPKVGGKALAESTNRTFHPHKEFPRCPSRRQKTQ